MTETNPNTLQGPFPVGQFTPAPPRPESPSTAGIHLNHTCLRVKDPQASQKFYNDLLGMHTLWVMNNGIGTIYYLAGRDQGMQHMATGSGHLELIHYPSDDDKSSYTSGNDHSSPSSIGYGHIGFIVPDAAKVLERAETMGYGIIKRVGEVEVQHTGADPAKVTFGDFDAGAKEMFKRVGFLRDPDGYWVEIIPSNMFG